MPKIRLGKRAIDGVGPQAKDQLFWDEELSGFGLKVTSSGTKIYLVQYRMGGRGNPTRRYTIGKHGSPWTPALARTEAERVLRLAQSGTDPQAAAREQQRVSVDLVFERYAERFLTDYGLRSWRPRTYTSAASDMRRWVLPKLRSKALPEIRRPDIAAVLDALPEKSPALPSNVFALMRKLFAWAVERGDIDRSPCDGMKSPASVPSRDRVLSDREVRRIWSATVRIHPLFGSMVRLLLITGQRRDEVAAMGWDELDQVQRLWRIPSARAKNKRAHIVPLSTLAVDELNALAPASAWPRQGLIFSTTGRTPISGFTGSKQRLDKAMVDDGEGDVTAWRLHDLRRTVATNLQRLAVRFEVTEAVLNLVSGAKSGIAGVYQRHDWAEEKTQALDAWSKQLAILLSATASLP